MRGVIFLVFITLSSFSWAQDNQDMVFVIAKPIDGKMHIRWAPNNAVVWKLANQVGYVLERTTVLRNGALLENPEIKRLNGGQIIGPAALEDFEKAAESSDYAAVSAQAIYGDDFEMDLDQATPFDAYNVSTLQENQFSFALYAADMDFNTALLSGLGFVDANIEENEKYLYKVVLQLDNIEVPCQGAFIEGAKAPPLPIPVIKGVRADKKSVIVQWEITYLEKSFTSYLVERSIDGGKSYQSLTKTSQLAITKEGSRKWAMKMDSLVTGITKPIYRVIGLSAFGEKSTASEPVSVEINRDEFLSVQIEKIEAKENAMWVQLNEPIKNKQQYQLALSRNREQFAPIESSWEQDNLLKIESINSGYIRVEQRLKNGSVRHSFPYLVQLPDSIAPAQPTKLQYELDTLGNPIIQWAANEENDLAGYRVYRSNFKEGEYTLITAEPITYNAHYDSLKTTLNKTTYYRIQAFDYRNNGSEYSEILEVLRKDVHPPITPVLKKCVVGEKEISVAFAPSPSADLAGHRLYVLDSAGWIMAKSFAPGKDKLVYENERRRIQIRLSAVDSTGNESGYSQTLTCRSTIEEDKEKTTVSAKIDRKNGRYRFQWELKGVRKIDVYKKVSGAVFQQYLQLNGDENLFEEQEFKKGDEYIFYFRMKDGRSISSNKIVI